MSLPGATSGNGDEPSCTVPLLQDYEKPVSADRRASWRKPFSWQTVADCLGWNSGVACAFLAALLFSFISLFVKLMEGHVNPFEVAFARTTVSAALGLPIALGMGIPFVCQSKGSIPMLALRAIFGAAAIITYYFSLFSLPIADAVVIGCMHPVITAVAAWALLGEDLGVVQILGCVVSVCGVVVIAQPDSLTSPDALQEQRLYGVAMGIASAMLSTGGSICIRVIGGREHALTTSLWFQFISMLLCAPPLILGYPTKVELPSAFDAGLLVSIGGIAFLGQLLLTRSLQLLPAFIALSSSFTLVAYSYMYGVLIFNDKMTLGGIAGTLMVTAGVLCVLMKQPSRHVVTAKASEDPENTEIIR